MSIRRQLALVFIGLMTGVFVISMLINSLFLNDFYTMRKEQELVKAYRFLNQGIRSDGTTTSEELDHFDEICSASNIAYVVTDEMFDKIMYLEMNQRILGTMVGRLTGYVLGFDADIDQTSTTSILSQKENYTIQRRYDSALDVDYLEIWGKLDAGYYFLFRILMESIRESSDISVDFMKYVCLAGILVSAVVIWIVSSRIAKPILELTDLSKRMADLDFGVKYTSGGNNEIGQLGSHFNQMSEKLEKAYSELMTANNELQKDIERKEKIDEKRREFLSNVSHELKTPIALIQGYAEGLKEGIHDDDPESRDYYCDVIIDEAGKMNRLVKSLLTLNQLEEGKETVVMERFDLVPLLKNKIASVSILAGQKNAAISYEGPDSLPVWGDEYKVEEVITNYLSNAIHYVEGERLIRVCVKDLEPKVRVEVTNTGPQIPEEDLGQIWDKFYKVDKARTRAYGGSGVGLSIVKAIMESIHQNYGVENLPDGVRFWFELESGSHVTG